MAILLSNKYKIGTSGAGFKVYISKGYVPAKRKVNGVIENYELEDTNIVGYVSTLERAFDIYIADRARKHVEDSGDLTAQEILSVIKEAREECRELWNTKFKEEDHESITRTVKRGLEEH